MKGGKRCIGKERVVLLFVFCLVAFLAFFIYAGCATAPTPEETPLHHRRQRQYPHQHREFTGTPGILTALEHP
ncbi:MAG: hypothetical protein ABDK94_10660 [Atribacterota bacterium]